MQTDERSDASAGPTGVRSRDRAVTVEGRWRAIVVGGGHAGCEAALALARSGADVLLLSQNVDRIGWMSCNPSIGGIGKSHLVREIDALGGLMPLACDRSSVHAKWLNASRGPAVRALRAQCDKLAYATAVRTAVESEPRVQIKQANIRALAIDGDRVQGVETSGGVAFCAAAVVLTTGTFLDAVLHTGLRQEAGGRMGEGPSLGLGDQLRALGVATLRHKTGTCPRVDGRTIDWSRVDADPGLDPAPCMSRRSRAVTLPQMSCHVAYTTAATHDIIRAHLDRSPLFTGVIAGTGPRYCPSIEDKVVRFADHERHYLFLEREGWQTQEVYVSGLSTSLPADAQIAMVRSVAGLEAAEIVRFGYAVEYDAVDARELGPDLGLRALTGLFLAGQINGTSGYEEAAAQGLVAGLNAAAFLRGDGPVVFSRADSYLGVLVDDLVTHGADEPYRMFTSRAEHRLELREGNADLRLTPRGRALGVISDDQWRAFERRADRLARARESLAEVRVLPDAASAAQVRAAGLGEISTPATLGQLACREGATWQALQAWLPAELRDGGPLALDAADAEEVLVEARYGGYVARERARQERARRLDAWPIPAEFAYDRVGGLSAEAVARLQRARPATLGQASRLAGITPAALQAIAFRLRDGTRRPQAPPV